MYSAPKLRFLTLQTENGFALSELQGGSEGLGTVDPNNGNLEDITDGGLNQW
ncbi:MAG: hypothetical protein KBS95_03425 [Alistipes sp.]|nr:hypothetical protein [Candidatus Alistipes equi]